MAGLDQEIKLDNSVVSPYNERSPEEIGLEAAVAINKDSLSEHFISTLDVSKRHREEIGIDDRLVACLRAFKGEYSPETLAIIQANGGTDVYRKETTGKAIDLASWLKDLFASVDERAWDMEPTPIPDLPPELMNQISGELQDKQIDENSDIRTAVELGEITFGEFEEFRERLNDPVAIEERREEMRTNLLREVKQEAQDRIDNMIRVCEDQQEQGNWRGSLSGFIEDFKIYPSAFIRGPFVKSVKMIDYSGGQAAVKTKASLYWQRVSPLNIFPAPHATTPQEGPFHEREYMSYADVHALLDLPGYNKPAILKVLRENRDKTQGDSVVALSDNDASELQGKPRPAEARSDSPFEAFHCYDSVPGYKLREYGVKVDSADAPYEVYCLMINNVVIKATLNADLLGRRPYSKDSFRPIPDSFWGESLSEAMDDIQQELNATARSMINNLGMSSGPMSSVDTSMLPEGSKIPQIAPWAVFQYDGEASSNARDPIKFHDIPCNVQLYFNAYNEIKKEADEVTGIPSFSHGSGSTQGAGETARGLAMLMDAAAKGIRDIIRSIGQNVIMDSLHRQYAWNMIYSPDESIKGDAQIRAKGPLAVIAAQQSQIELGNFLERSLNPIDSEIIGKKRRAELLRKQAPNLNLSPDDIAPSSEDFDEEEKEKQAGMEQEGLPLEAQPQQQVQQ